MLLRAVEVVVFWVIPAGELGLGLVLLVLHFLDDLKQNRMELTLVVCLAVDPILVLLVLLFAIVEPGILLDEHVQIWIITIAVWIAKKGASEVVL